MHRYRSHNCGELRAADVDTDVRLSGWLHNRRDLGGILFIDLRDHYGLVQLVARPGTPANEALGSLTKETVVRIDGKVSAIGGAEHLDGGHLDLDLARRQVGVDVVGAARADLAVDADDGLLGQGAEGLVGGGAGAG
ncbi:OB-fold nucleic acid binding domain-containing protein, partial [Streptomyces angustmyceticus]|uniref:OB-fold nucleic acid binding domain-containing protein n=1 Tax=Streptomyces angustmyceticus TaxID=285578 RepID=UPI001FCA4874